MTLSTTASSQNNSSESVTPRQNDSSQGTNPTLQSDGTMAPPQHAPEPDVYAQQHGVTDSGAQTGQSNPPADGVNGSDNGGTQPQYRPQYPQGSSAPHPPYPPSGPAQQPYSQGTYPGNYPARQPNPAPPYGAQLAGQPVTVPQGSLLRIRINEGLDSQHSQPGTPFDAVVLNDVVANGAVAIPRGASVQGTVTDARSGGVIKGSGQLALQLNQVTLGGRTFPYYVGCVDGK